MDKANEKFQALLANNHLGLKQVEEDDQWLYYGKFPYSSERLIDFVMILSKSDDFSIGQIVFSNVAHCSDASKKAEVLNLINEVNRSLGLFYYLAMEEDGRIFARYIVQLKDDMESFINILKAGSKLLKHFIPALDEILEK